MDSMVAHSAEHSPRCSRTLGGNLFHLLFVARSFQSAEPPPFLGRFTAFGKLQFFPEFAYEKKMVGNWHLLAYIASLPQQPKDCK